MLDTKSPEDTLMKAVQDAADIKQLEDVRVRALGKKGEITAQMKTLGKMEPEQRKEAGQALNHLKTRIADALEARQKVLHARELEARLAAETLDVTLPVHSAPVGRIHPITRTMEEFIAIFADMGFTMAQGPEIESDWYNLEALNIGPTHPARQMQDTFYLPEDEDGKTRVMRTQTSNVQIRTMEKTEPPIRIISPGKVFRSDYDMTHTPVFHQIEGLIVDETTTMAHLKGTLLEWMRRFFEIEDLNIRFRPAYFPFTEPSAEMDIACSKKGGVKLGNYGDWLELGGCGMVHPQVLRNCNIDPDKYQGFAFGFGIERLAMLKYGMPDLRPFFDADIRWLRHYGFGPQARPNLATGE
ncbi:MAG: phenylalanine--tRNA ligase subunit alpha [Alphaproteobacteria bacterium]